MEHKHTSSIFIMRMLTLAYCMPMGMVCSGLSLSSTCTPIMLT